MIIKENMDEILSYLEDSSNFSGGHCDKVYIPESEEDVVEIINTCNSKNIPLTISGGGTGTVGGRIPTQGSVISIERLNRIIDINQDKAICEAGLVINQFLSESEKINRFYPPFPTERSAFIGGNTSTNASGEYSFRFGPTRSYILKIRMVTGSGRLIEIPRGRYFADENGVIKTDFIQVKKPSYTTPKIKCSAGYFSAPKMDLIDLIIGSEGTLGVITYVEAMLVEKLPDRFIMIFFLPSEERMFEFLYEVKKDFIRDMYTLEFFDESSLSFLKSDFSEIPEKTCAFYIESVNTIELMEKWLELSEKYQTKDVWVGNDPKNYQRLIDFRHRLPENINAYFRKLKITKISLDIAVPEENFRQLVNFYRKFSNESGIRTVLFGHIGENHLHFNLFPVDEREKTLARQIYVSCVEKALSLGGTISAEHGIGKIKYPYLRMMYGDGGIEDMINVKKAFDPRGLIGRDNLFPADLLLQKL
ncbi:MAG TPA: FAD-binding oxidoreductase [Candidatus Ratteibacteria bacterium]|uniref:FAD-linked oxidoreductase n=1 Tax=candidate division TA06 bacterium ADurb.Bin131 TaxID=1852827 RepID=A0A1V6CBX0_UNCT6|nr:MAG: putative FAD-linked oxidoreductase [candidate division TA06 bacterium ADurb.Bin131]HOC01882.1 FAD-binding oxidoreductase [bacterium]HRS05873.1 FAD-binding oxidoreductase [Candidatus Ratteibacteria bacterium]HON05052.1 FAD-binding oxidoreductase [bacterium]HPC29492.1 FAD-binding oxidoreductase [bacterium]